MNRLEQQSLNLSKDEIELHKRLRDAQYCLIKELRDKFKQAIFDLDKKRLISDGYYLQWKVRQHPNELVSYNNQQTSIGIVTLESEV